jgi:hypothetical protein
MTDDQETQQTCGNCVFWAGHCLKSKINRIAATLKCELFEAKREILSA